MSFSSSPSPSGSSRSSLASMRISRCASSRELVTDTHSPSAIEPAPARSPARPVTRMPWLSIDAPATPMTRLRFEQSPSFAPRTAARSALPPTDRCRPSSRPRKLPCRPRGWVDTSWCNTFACHRSWPGIGVASRHRAIFPGAVDFVLPVLEIAAHVGGIAHAGTIQRFSWFEPLQARPGRPGPQPGGQPAASTAPTCDNGPARTELECRVFFKEVPPMRFLTLTSLAIAALLSAAAAPASGQTFVFGAQGEPVQLDPAVITDGISSRLTRQIFDGLVKYRGATTEVEPALAEKWEVSRDGKVWTFQLRRSVKFHDGTPLDAAAVVWNFERWWKAAHPQHDNQVKAGQTFEYWEAQFGGFDDKSVVSAVEAVGSHTVRVTLKEPQAPFLANLAMFVFDIASPKAVERWGTDFGKHPVGTGAYRFVEWKPNQEVILEANPELWGPKAKGQRVVVRNIKDNSQPLGALKAGQLHGMEGLNPDDDAVVKGDANLQLLLRPTNTTGYIAFNYKVKEFQDKRVRQAFAHAINKRAIVDALYGGTGMVASQFQPPALWGYNRELKDFEYSPSKAQALLREAGRGQGLSEITWDDGKKEPLIFWYMSRSRPYFPNPKEIAEAMAADLAKVGIKVALQTAEWAVYLDKRKNGQLSLYMLGWTGDNGDPDNFLCYFFCQPGAAREGFYANTALADLLLRAQKLTQQSERAKLYRQAEQMLHDDVGRLFIANNRPPLAFSKRVKGDVPPPTGSEDFDTAAIQSRSGIRAG